MNEQAGENNEKTGASNGKPKKRAGSNKKPKTRQLTIHEDEKVKPEEAIPEGSRFKGYHDFVVQNLEINVRNTRYRLERWLTPYGKTLTGKLPSVLKNRHFGPQLISYILYQHHHCQTTQPLLLLDLNPKR